MIDAITYALLKGDIGQGTQEAVAEYLDEHLTNPSNPPIDTSLEISGAAADSKTTGDKITQLKEDFNLLNNFAESISDRIKTGIALDFQNKTGYWDKDKTFVDYTTYQVRGASVPVNTGEEYLLTSASYYGMARVAFFDESDAVVDVIWSSNDNALQTDTYIKIPSSATTMLIQAVGNAYTKAVLTKLGDYEATIYDDAVKHGLIDLKSIIDDNFTLDYSDVSSSLTFEDKTGYYDKSGGFSTYNNVKGATIAVVEGEEYLLTSKSFYSMARAVFFNSSNVFVSAIYSSNDATLHTDTHIIVPATATTMLIQRIGANEVLLKKGTSMVIPFKSILNGKNITVIGDSITEHNWRAATNWAMYISEWTGAVIQNLGASGTGFAKSSPYINRISNIKASPDIIGVALSWNDMSAELPIGNVTDTGTSSLCGYANDFFDALITAFPTVPIICYVQNVWSAYRYGVVNSDEWFNKFTEICALKGIPFYGDMYKGSVLRPWNTANRAMYFTSDGETQAGTENTEHPNSNGHKAIARYLYPKFADNLVSVGLDYIM